MKMKDNGNRSLCGRSDDIVGYIYNEIPSDDRISFENHLAGCTSCTDEFAAISDARFSLFEWHKEEFAHLPTPEFSIPYEVKSISAPGFVAAIEAFIRNAGWAATSTAAILLLAGIGFMMFTFLGPKEADIARIELADPPIAVNSADDYNVNPFSTPDVDKDDLSGSEKVRIVGQAKVNDRPAVRRRSQKVQNMRITRTPTPTLGKVPVLSNFEENVDRSLRLSALLDEVGG